MGGCCELNTTAHELFVEIGGEMGAGFGRGLLRAAGVEGGALDLSQKLGGDRRTALRAVQLLISADEPSLTSVRA